jgi:hypothetical protein
MPKGIHGSYERQGSILKKTDGTRLLIQQRPPSKQSQSKASTYLLGLPREGDAIKSRQYISSLWETGEPNTYELEWKGARFILWLKMNTASIHPKESNLKQGSPCIL